MATKRENATGPLQAHLLLGRDHEELGHVALRVAAEGRLALGLSAGSDPVVTMRKADDAQVNEDVVYAGVGTQRWVMAVADGHDGPSASHALMTYLATHAVDYPRRLEARVRWWQTASEQTHADGLSGTTMLVAAWEPAGRRVVGLAYGDSRAWRYRPGRALKALTRPNRNYVRPGDLYAWRASHASTFDAPFLPGDVLLLHTDGVDECCYRDPARSVQKADLRALLEAHGGQPEACARAILAAALEGVRGQPGGQDNVGLIVARPGV